MKQRHSSSTPAKAISSPGLRCLTWINIAVQTAFPLAVAFTPVMAGAGEQHFLRQPAPLSAMRTQAYTLGPGETTASVAQKFHLTPGQLRELNQLRTFSHGFDHLRQGDELDVPVPPCRKRAGRVTLPLLTQKNRIMMNRHRRWPDMPRRRAVF